MTINGIKAWQEGVEQVVGKMGAGVEPPETAVDIFRPVAPGIFPLTQC